MNISQITMKQLRPVLLSFAIIISGQMYSQSIYMVGTSQACIEPDQSSVSLHLGGYGAPRDGRFSLQWKKIGSVPETASMCCLNDIIYILSKGEILFANTSGGDITWKKAGNADNIRTITATGGKLYSVNSNGELLETKSEGAFKWATTGSADRSIVALAASGGSLFAVNGKGTLWSADLSKKNPEWTYCESVNNIISIAAGNGKLYALTSDGVIYQNAPGKKDNKWLKIAYRNGQTIKEEIEHITIINDRLSGISVDNYLYIGEHRSEGNLTARAMAVKAEDRTVVIVNADVCGLSDTFTGWLKKDIFKKCGIPASAVFINSSHTHFAPVSQEWLTWQEPNQRPDSNYLFSTVRNGIMQAIDGALADMKPAELSFGRGSSNIGYNRSLKDHPELYDNSVDVIRVDYSGSDAESYLFLAGCHPVFSTAGKLHYTISANYPGVARKLVEERTGTTNAIFLQGTAGDINPVDNGEYITGEKLSNEVIAVLSRPTIKVEGAISFYLDTINIPIKPWTREEISSFRTQNIDKTGDIYAEKNVKWCDLMLQYYKENRMPSSLPVYVNTINIGNWKLVGLSRDTATAYNFGVENIWRGQLVSVAGYTNDVSSYLPTNMHIEDGVYEGLDSFFWYGMPAVFPKDVEEIILTRIESLKR